jgi:hypothetical protein
MARMTGRVVAGTLALLGVIALARRLADMISRATGTRIVTNPPATPPSGPDRSIVP